MRRRHRVRYAVLAVSAVGLAGLGYVVVGYAFRTHPGPKPLYSAVHGFNGNHGTTATGLRYEPPAQGVYELEGHGSEHISFPPNSQADGAVMPATVTYLANGCWRWHDDYNVAHWDEYVFCPTGQKLLQQGNRNSQSWDFGTLTVSNLASFTCQPSAVWLEATPSAGQHTGWACTGTNTAVPGQTTSTVVSRVIGTVWLSIGGDRVQAVHITQTATLTGGQKGTAVEDWWLSASSGLPLRVERQITLSTASPLGNITYRESGSWQMASLTPHT